MFDTSKNELDYVKRFYNDHIKKGVVLERHPADLAGWELNDEPVPFSEAVTKQFRPFKEGDEWGNPWSTLWLQARAKIPSNWRSLDDVDVVFDVDLNFTNQPGFQAEGLIYSPEGEPIKAINPLNNLYEVDGDELDVYLELAANPNIGEFDGYTPTLMGRKETAPEVYLYKLKRANLAQRSLRMLELKRDFDTLIALAEILDENSSRRFEIIKAMMDAVHALDLRDKHGSAVDSGRIMLDNEDITHVPAENRYVNTVFQSYALFPHMTVFENVAFGLRMQKTPAAEITPRVMEALRMVQLETFAQRKPHQLSGGQQQRVGIARVRRCSTIPHR
mgnify:CR=1 FL=1